MNSLEWTIAQALEGETVETQALKLKAEAEPQLGALHDKVNDERAEIDKHHESALAIPAELRNFEVVLDDLWIMAKAKFERCHHDYLRAKQELKAYAMRHGIARSPMVPEGAQNFLDLGLLIFLEAVLNAGFLNNADMVAGPVQALLAAFMISLTNVAVSTSGGYFIGRWLTFGLHSAEPNLPEFKWKRYAAWFAFFGFIVVMLQFHLTVGLIRTQETLHQIQHSISRYMEIVSTPEALFLVMVGIVMSGLSWKKGVCAFGDPYPGYGELHRRVEGLKEQGMNQCEESKEKISERFGVKREEVSIAEKDVFKKREEHNHKVADCQKSERTLNRVINDTENDVRFEIAKIAHHHSVASNRVARKIAKVALEQYVHFNNYRMHDTPVFLNMPDFSDIKNNLDKAEAKALQQLAVLFESVTQSSNGE